MKNTPTASKQQVIQLLQHAQFQQALDLCQKLCDQAPENPDSWFLLGAISGQTGDFIRAEACCRKAIELQPNNHGLRYSLGITLLNQNKLTDAIECFEHVLRFIPQHAEARNDLANARQMQGDKDQAIKEYQRAIQIQPAMFSAHYNLGNTYRDMGRLDDAAACYKNALEIKPDLFQAYAELSGIYLARLRYDDAILLLERAISLNPADNSLRLRLGMAYLEDGQSGKAISILQAISDDDPTHAEALYLTGRALRMQGNLSLALEHMESVIRTNPEHAEAHAILGGIRKEQGRIEECIEAFRTALTLKPERKDFRSSFLLNINYTDSLTPEEQFSEHLHWGQLHVAGENIKSHWSNSADTDRVLRIGYISPDFRTHSVAHFFEPLLENHNRSEFKCFCYADHRIHPADATTKRLQVLADHWCDITRMDDNTVSRRIQEDSIDILVDLAGHTSGNRLGVFSCKPAPIQVSYLGYPNTTGMSTIDYRLTDYWADPEGNSDILHTETLARLPEGFLCYKPPEAPNPARPPSLSTNHITFGSFNNLAKVTPRVVRTWCEILKSVPGSCLVLKNTSFRDPATCEDFLQQFSRHGVDRKYISLLPGMASFEQHLAFYSTIDIALDTFPYNGTTTTCEALWMGVPVITLTGKTHASRVGASLLSQVGLNDHIASSVGDYRAIASRLASSPEELCNLHRNLRDRMMRSSLCNATGKARSIEAFYRAAWGEWCAQSGKI